MEPVLMGNEILTIDADTRTIEVPSDFLLGVETDNDAERVEFQCPKIVGDNLDLSQYHIYIHYQNAKGEKGKYLCEDIEDGGENITFSWLLSQKVTLYKGQTKFLVCAKKTQEDTIVWNTTLANGNVLEGLDVDEDIVQQNDDVIEQILLKLEQIEASGGTGDINNAKVTFTEAEERANIESQETMSTIFGKIKKWFSDLKTVAFTGSYNDLSNKPDIPEAYTLPQANENQLGGIKAKAKTTEDNEVAIGSDGKLYANSASQEQINTAVDNAINDGRLANMTIKDDSITGEKLKNEIITLDKLSNDLKNDLLDIQGLYETVEDDLGTRLKCLTSDGNQYCKTDVVIDASTVGRYEIQVCLPADTTATSQDKAPIFGYTGYNNNSTGSNICLCTSSTLTIRGNYGNIKGTYGTWNIDDLLSNKNKLTYFVFTKTSRMGYYEDGTTWGWVIDTDDVISGTDKIILPIYIFAINDSYAHNSFKTTKKPISIYYIRVFDEDDILIHEFLPYLDKNNKPCMMDAITGKAYYNSGTGEFTYEEVD